MVPHYHHVMYYVSVLMFWRDYSRYTRTRELPWLSRHLPDWLPAFPLDITSRMQVACHWSAAGHVTWSSAVIGAGAGPVPDQLL